MEQQAQKQIGGFRLQRISYVIVAFVFLISGLLLFAALEAGKGYTKLQIETEQLMSARQDSQNMRMGSDYLTQQIQNYVVTEDWERVELYFEEAKENQRRERALEGLTEVGEDEEALKYLSEALASSEVLMETEYRAIALILASNGERPADLPEEVAAIELTSEELAMSPEEQKAKAQELVFGAHYQEVKTEINEAVQRCTDQLIAHSRDSQENSAAQLKKIIRLQQVLIVLQALVMLLFVIVLISQVILPLLKNVKLVQAGESMEVVGSYEVRFLAESYNDIFLRNKADKEALSYEATHDPLTGLYNRKAYEKVLETRNHQKIALILADVDHFKGVNDTYGHETGDRVLQRVAEVLQERFRSEDFVCRIGGDEFAVLMVNASSNLEALVREKMKDMSELLRVPRDNVPGVTMSVGIAFGDRLEEDQTLYQNADRALYDVKERGRDGFAIFSNEKA